MLTPVVAYNILVTGRLLIACYVGAKHAGELAVQQEAQRVIQAASLLLHMMVVSMPIALGAAEVLDETCRGEYVHEVERSRHSVRLTHHQTCVVHDRGCYGREERVVPIIEQIWQIGLDSSRAAGTTAPTFAAGELEQHDWSLESDGDGSAELGVVRSFVKVRPIHR